MRPPVGSGLLEFHDRRCCAGGRRDAPDATWARSSGGSPHPVADPTERIPSMTTHRLRPRFFRRSRSSPNGGWSALDAGAGRATGSRPTASAGSTTGSCARRTASTARARARGRSTSRTGIVTWETQQTDYPSNGADVPDYEPRGCPRGASFSLVRLLAAAHPPPATCAARCWSATARRWPRTGDPVEAWAAIVDDPAARAAYTSQRGKGGFVRASWDEVADAGRRRPRPHHPPLGPGPRVRLLADPGDVDGLLRGRHALLLADGRRAHQLLRLVRRPAAGLAAGLGRPDRRARVGRLVERDLPDDVGLQRAHDAHARRALHDRGALPRPEDRRGLARLLGPHQVRRPLARRPSRAPTARWRWRWPT